MLTGGILAIGLFLSGCGGEAPKPAASTATTTTESTPEVKTKSKPAATAKRGKAENDTTSIRERRASKNSSKD
jgi:hypothetical protein